MDRRDALRALAVTPAAIAGIAAAAGEELPGLGVKSFSLEVTNEAAFDGLADAAPSDAALTWADIDRACDRMKASRSTWSTLTLEVEPGVVVTKTWTDGVPTGVVIEGPPGVDTRRAERLFDERVGAPLLFARSEDVGVAWS